MITGDLYLPLVIFQLIVSGFVFFLLLFLSAPYGKHSRKGWGPSIGSRTAWMIMELPAVIVILVVFVVSRERVTSVNLIFLFLWETHYIYRTFIYPAFFKGSKRNFPLIIVSFAFIFNFLNGCLNGFFIATFGARLESTWFYSIPFIAGMFLFISGMVLHVRSDGIIRSMRKSGDTGYKVPSRGPFKLVSNPNYLGEIVQWWGWALLTFSLAGLAFAVFTTANLVPRAISNHRWYRDHFKDHPPDRRILVPYLF